MPRSQNRKPKKPTPLISGQPLTPAQQRAHAETKRQNDEQRRWLCNAFSLWLVCGEKACRRGRSCLGDMHACFQRWWWLVPEQNKVRYRVLVRARADGLSHQDACRAADAEVVRAADQIALVNAEIVAKIDALEAARHGK